MTRDELIYDMLLILSKSKISDDSRIDPRHMGFLIDKYRAEYIRQEFKRNRSVGDEYVQDFGLVDFQKILSSDDPSVSFGSIYLGKWRAPSIVSMDQDYGLYRVAGGSKMKGYSVVGFNRLMHIIETISVEASPLINPKATVRYVARQGNDLFIYPFASCVNVALILDNPLEGLIFDTHKVISGAVQEGVQYLVHDGQVSYNGTVYNHKEFITGLPGKFTYSGKGYLSHIDKKRQLTGSDPYPMSLSIASTIAINILTKEFGFEQKVVSDIINDGADQQQVLTHE